MKIYILDDNENCYDEAGLLLYKVVTSIVHFESSDREETEQDLPAEEVE